MNYFIEQREIDLLHEVCIYYGIPFPIAYNQILTESGFNQNAESKVGAKGISQFMQATFEDVKKKIPDSHCKAFGVDRLTASSWDWKASLLFYGYYMGVEIPRIMKAYNIPDTWKNRLACYNGGFKYPAVLEYSETKKYYTKILSFKKKALFIAFGIMSLLVILFRALVSERK